MRPGTALMPMMNSSKSVDLRPEGSIRGTGENSLPQAEYCGARRLSPPEWMISARLSRSGSGPSSPRMCVSAAIVAPPEPMRAPSGSGSTAYRVFLGSMPFSSRYSIWRR